MCLHYSVFISLAELEQMRCGFSTQKFNSLIETYPKLLRQAFEPVECNITSDFVQDLFCPIFFPEGSNQRVKEEAIIMAWIQYLQHLEGK